MSIRFQKPIRGQSTWRAGQERRKRAATFKRIRRSLVLYIPVFTVLLFVVYSIAAGVGRSVYSRIRAEYNNPPEAMLAASVTTADVGPDSHLLPKGDLQAFISPAKFINLTEESFDVQTGDGMFRIDTSLDESLQQYLVKKMQRKHARYLGIVVMEPDTGRVLAMTGFDRYQRDRNPCVDARFPAASIFKIVTAAAGLEKCGFTPSSRFSFNGGKYTLYKRQLREKTNRYSNWISLRDSFAQSVNPVFGKIGALHLGRIPLEQYGYAFGFNHTFNFEIPLTPSNLNLTDETYQWAEVASGFNHSTTMSPLHGALISAAIVNDGAFVEPTIVDAITGADGAVYYKGEAKTVGQAVSPEVSRQLKRLMGATVRSGTSRKAFRGSSSDRVLSRLIIGGKTGSISSRKIDHVRYDWFVGFAQEKQGNKKLALAVMVAHEKYIGKRAAYYARIAIKKYFDRYFDIAKTSDTYAPARKKQTKDKAA